MEVEGRSQSQSFMQEELSRCRGHKVIATYNFGHTLSGVIHYNCQLIGRRPCGLPHDKVAANLTQVDVRWPEQPIDKRRRGLDAKPPGQGLADEVLGIIGAAMSTGSRINRPLVFEMRSAGRPFDVTSGTGARIHGFLQLQPLKSLLIEGQPLRLDHDFTVPVEPQPAEVFLDQRIGAFFDPWRINILNAKKNGPAARSCGQPGDQIGAGIANMLRPSRGRRKTADGRGHGFFLLPHTLVIPLVTPPRTVASGGR